MNIPKAHTNRILSIDIMRGITLFLMLFVNDIYAPGVPGWLLHTAAATACLFLHAKLPAVVMLWVFFILLNVLSQLGSATGLTF